MKSLEYLATRNAGRFDIVEKDGPRTVFRLALDNGASGIVEDWELFEGVNLTFNDIPHGSLTWKSSEPRSLHIEWCQQGRGEIASANGKSYFIHERECAVHDQRIIKRQMRYPMPRYVGLTLSIEYETGSSTLRAHDATGGVDFNALRERYAGGDGCRIFLPDDTLASLLASFYRIDDRARIERMRLKALELVALLDATERPVWKTFPYCTHDHARARPARQQPGRRPRARRCGALREHGPLHVQAALPARLWAVAHGVPPPMPRRGRRASACGEPRERRQRRGARGLPQPQQVRRRLRRALRRDPLGLARPRLTFGRPPHHAGLRRAA